MEDKPISTSEVNLEPLQVDKDGVETRFAPYSVFTKTQKVTIVAFVTAAGIFSPLSAYVYFPALRTIANDYIISMELINLTVTAYLLAQAFAPSILADISERFGRRPTYIFSFVLYCAASIGLVFQRHYAILLVLRMLQSAGSSPTVSLAFGVIGDIAAPHERGLYVGASHVGFNLAPALGPVIGGLIAEKAGWPWIFVFLAAASGLLLVLMLLFLQETSRTVVGNGDRLPTGLNRTVAHMLLHGSKGKGAVKVKLRVPDILPCFTMMFHKDTFPLLAAYSVFYMMYSVLQATTAPLFEDIYHLTPLQAGLCYLAYGFAGGTASHVLGTVADRDYRITARQHNFAIDYHHGDDLMHFPIEKARLRSIFVYMPVCAATTIAYGWALDARAHLAVPIILQFVIGFSVIGIFNICNTLLTDTHPQSPVIAVASANIARCLVAAGGVALIQLLISAVGTGWAFTVVGALCFLMIPVLFLVRQKGWHWRKQSLQAGQLR